jgi:hypothetical protein
LKAYCEVLEQAVEDNRRILKSHIVTVPVYEMDPISLKIRKEQKRTLVM